LRREEKYPWVIEDGTGSEVWVGQMEEVSKAETHGFFMPTSENKFQFVPAHRWYKFQKKQKHIQLSAEEVEKLVCLYIGIQAVPLTMILSDGTAEKEQRP